MLSKTAGALIATLCLVLCGLSTHAQDQKRSGNVIGVIKSQKPTPNGKNTFLEVLAPGEEKARTYRVQYDPKAMGPIPAVLAAVRAAKVGDRVQFDWVDTGEGLAIKTFHVLKSEETSKKSVLIGELKTRTDSKDGKNSIIEVLAPGEEKARSYFVNYDPEIKGPIPSVLAAVRAAKIGDRVEFEWISTNHGPAITSFKVFRKSTEK
jgi:plastocyanin